MSEYNSLNPLNYALSDKVLDNLEATILGKCNLGDCFLCRGLAEKVDAVFPSLEAVCKNVGDKCTVVFKVQVLKQVAKNLVKEYI